jgi:hypothetical protein
MSESKKSGKKRKKEEGKNTCAPLLYSFWRTCMTVFNFFIIPEKVYKKLLLKAIAVHAFTLQI